VIRLNHEIDASDNEKEAVNELFRPFERWSLERIYEWTQLPPPTLLALGKAHRTLIQFAKAV